MSTPNIPRTDHLVWAKTRALAQLATGTAQDLPRIWAIFDETLAAHPETADHQGRDVGVRLLLARQLDTVEQMRVFIEGLR